jgi:hypothetical protein
MWRADGNLFCKISGLQNVFKSIYLFFLLPLAYARGTLDKEFDEKNEVNYMLK